MPEVESAYFELLDEPIDDHWIIRVEATGTGFEDRAAPRIRAKVGEVEVEVVSSLPDGEGFTGLLAEQPADGDRLKVGWSDGELVDTDVTFALTTE